MSKKNKKQEELVNEEVLEQEVIETDTPQAEEVEKEEVDLTEASDEELLDAYKTFDDDVTVDVNGEEYLDPEKVIEEFTDAAKKIDNFVTKDTTTEELNTKLEAELAHAEEVEAQLQKQIAELEKKTPKHVQESFSKFWAL